MEDSRVDHIELVILGAGPAYSNVPGSLGSAYLVRSATGSLVLDLGQGTFPSLAALVEPSELAGVVISHLHPDHFIDLIPLRHYLKRVEATSDRLVPLLAADGLEGRLDATWGTPAFSSAAFEHIDLDTASYDVGPFTVEAARVTHTADSFGFRVALAGSERPGLVYTGDVGVAADVEPLVRPGDLLLSEATFGPGPTPEGMPHIDAIAAGSLATRTGASQLVITHVRMGHDPNATMRAASSVFRGPASFARPDARFVLPGGS